MRIAQFLKDTIDGKLSLDEQKAYLEQKPFGSPEEIAEAVEYLYGQMSEMPNLPDAIDVCGTGGSGLARLNISTISAFIVAGAGVKVAKHGNNAASGKFGSFDLLSALDVPINLSLQELQLRYNSYNLAFLYAKSFHPAMRFFAPVRAQINQPTFFNILGPLLSPVSAKRQFIGTPKVEYARLIAEVSKSLGKDRVIVATGSDGLDEITLSGPTHIFELNGGVIKEYDISPADFGVAQVGDFSDISVKDPGENVKIAQSILAGAGNGRLADLVLVNAAMALYLAGKSDDLKECYRLAKDSLESGRAKKTLDVYRMPDSLAKIIARDPERDFTVDSELVPKARRYTGGIIAEIKRASPSEGEINAAVDIAAQAKLYEASGASAISVLTEPEDFGGSFDDLKKVRASSDLPILCKDFIVRKEHIDKAKSCGADIILLIAAILDEDKMRELYDHAYGLGLQAIVEVHTKSELEKALRLKPEIVGVNSRDLHDFSIRPEIFEELARSLSEKTIKVAESGISSYKDVPNGYDGILAGTVLMKHPFANLKMKELSGKPLLKLCGIREVEDARLCGQLGADMIGINFVPRSNRKVSIDQAKQLVSACENAIPVGIFEDQDPDEVNRIARDAGIKAVQLSGHETELEKYELPIIKTVRLGEPKPSGAFMTIIDNTVSGSGKRIDMEGLEPFEPSLVAGGVDLAAAKEILKSKSPLGIDTASGIETGGKVDQAKIRAFCELVSLFDYAS